MAAATSSSVAASKSTSGPAEAITSAWTTVVQNSLVAASPVAAVVSVSVSSTMVVVAPVVAGAVVLVVVSLPAVAGVVVDAASSAESSSPHADNANAATAIVAGHTCRRTVILPPVDSFVSQRQADSRLPTYRMAQTRAVPKRSLPPNARSEPCSCVGGAGRSASASRQLCVPRSTIGLAFSKQPHIVLVLVGRLVSCVGTKLRRGGEAANVETSDRPSSTQVLNGKSGRDVEGFVEVAPIAAVGCHDADVDASVGIVAVQTCGRRSTAVTETTFHEHRGCPLHVGSGDQEVEILVTPSFAPDERIDSPAAVDPCIDVCLVHRRQDADNVGRSHSLIFHVATAQGKQHRRSLLRAALRARCGAAMQRPR